MGGILDGEFLGEGRKTGRGAARGWEEDWMGSC
jgi:hypothetical protein